MSTTFFDSSGVKTFWYWYPFPTRMAFLLSRNGPHKVPSGRYNGIWVNKIRGSVGSFDFSDSKKLCGCWEMVCWYSAERETVSRRTRVKSPARNSDEGSPKCFLNRARAVGETVSDTPISWFPGNEAIYGDAVVSRNTFLNRRYSFSQLLLTLAHLGESTLYRPTHGHRPWDRRGISPSLDVIIYA